MSDDLAVRFVEGQSDLIEGMAIPFGGRFKFHDKDPGSDLTSLRFTPKTDFALDLIKDRPLMFSHGLDKDVGFQRIGDVTSYRMTDKGIWAQAKLAESLEFKDEIRGLVEKGALGFSSGSVERWYDYSRKTGEVRSYPWIELSLTPRPADFDFEVHVTRDAPKEVLAGLEAKRSASKKAIRKAGSTARRDLINELIGKAVKAALAAGTPTDDDSARSAPKTAREPGIRISANSEVDPAVRDLVKMLAREEAARLTG